MVVLDRDLNKTVAEMVSQETNAIRDAADEVASLARAKAGRHTRSGAYAASIHVERRNQYDFQVVADAPFSAAIEFGHTASGWYENVAPGTWIPGIHALRDAAIEVQRTVRK